MYPRASSIVQFIFFFWSFDISVNIQRNQKYYKFRPMYSKLVFDIRNPFGLITVFGLTALLKLLHRNSTVARRVTNDTSEHYGNP